MRHSPPAVIALAILAAACASARGPAPPPPFAACPYRVVATVSNPGPYRFDVYYQEPGKSATAIGEVLAGGDATVTVPGEGRGQVFLRRPQSDQQYTAYNGRPLRQPTIRVHCSGR